MRRWPRVRFAAYAICVLIVPAALMATGRPQQVDLGRLTMILLPGPLGMLFCAEGVRGRPRWRWVALAPLVTLAVSACGLGVAAAAGLVQSQGHAPNLGVPLSAAGLSTLTSLLEEWGWAGAGLTLSVGALGQRWGVVALGLVWAAWHLIPVALGVGMFPDLEGGPPVRLVSFVAACVAYRALLTGLQQRAGSWLAAAMAHAAPNAVFAALMAAGIGGFHAPSAWALYPAPGGLAFLALTVVAVLLLGKGAPRTRPPSHDLGPPAVTPDG